MRSSCHFSSSELENISYRKEGALIGQLGQHVYALGWFMGKWTLSTGLECDVRDQDAVVEEYLNGRGKGARKAITRYTVSALLLYTTRT